MFTKPSEHRTKPETWRRAARGTPYENQAGSETQVSDPGGFLAGRQDLNSRESAAKVLQVAPERQRKLKRSAVAKFGNSIACSIVNAFFDAHIQFVCVVSTGSSLGGLVFL